MQMDDRINRRDFLRTSALVTTGAVLATQFTLRPALAKDKDWIAVLGQVKDLNEKEPVLVKAQFKDVDGNLMQEEKLFVRWQKQGKTGHWVVLSSICTHLKCKIDYNSNDEAFKCPCHGSMFDLDGRVSKKPAKKDLPDYSDLAYEEDGQLKLSRAPE
jgi:menaquinol-cytochrome c reductase iron-sulfur subunit